MLYEVFSLPNTCSNPAKIAEKKQNPFSKKFKKKFSIENIEFSRC